MRNPVNIVFENPINGDYFEHCNNVSETCVDINCCYPKRDKDAIKHKSSKVVFHLQNTRLPKCEHTFPMVSDDLSL